MSTRSLGQLTLDLVTRTGGFTGPLDRASRHTKKTMKDISSSVKTATAAITASTVAVAAAGAGLYAYTKSGMDNIDTQVKLARQVDATIGELRGVTRAAEDAGVAQGRLEGSLLSYNKRLGDTIRGTGEAKKAYEALGIEASELAEMPLPDQLALISDRINQLDTTAARTSIADKLMSGGRETVKLFESGSDAIHDAVQEIEDYGRAIDMIDASVIEAANDALDRTTLVTDSARDALAVELAPVILEVTDRFNEASREAGGLGEYVSSAVDTSVDALGALLDSYHELVVFNQRVVVGTNDMDLAFANFSKNAWEWLGDLHDLSYKWVNLLIRGMNYVSDADIPEIKYEGSDLEERHKRRVQEARGDRNLAQMELNHLLDESSPSEYLEELLADAEKRRQEIAANAYRDQFKPLDQWFLTESDIPRLGTGDDDEDSGSGSDSKAAREAAKAEREAAREAERQRRAYRGLLDELYPLKTSQREFREEMELLDLAAQAGEVDDLSDAQQKLRDSYLSSQSVAEAYGAANVAALEDSRDAAEEFGMTFSSSLEDAIVKGQSLQDMISGLSEDLLRLSTRKLVTEPLAGAISSGITGIIGGSSVPGGFTSQIDTGAAFIGQAHGGWDSVPETGTYYLKKGERVTTSETSDKLDRTLDRVNASQQSAGSVDVDVHIHNEGGGQMEVSRTEQRRGSSGKRELHMWVKQEVRNLLQGGDLDRDYSNAFGLNRRPR
ncbi:hypothetical protein [Halomonas elongata]|uniref:hypothetical protein n=1 Tax=Halomonas elongata TaxID=2746 RepID=UPI00186B9FE4|nr:hypothetical protein [Halomonas elongata]MBW5800057.1 hypothetical protein [Halomonas elongata]